MPISFKPDIDFWPGCGYALLNRDADGRLVVSDDFLRAYLMRPEIAPVVESCANERALHAALMEEPKRPVTKADLATFEDPDGVENYQVVLDFRDRLIKFDTVEACYQSLFRGEPVRLPQLFYDQMAEVVLRNILDGADDPFQVRAAEVLFREQNVTIQDGAILLGDTETVEMLATTGGMGSLGQLMAEAGTRPRQVDMDVLQPETADIYWERNARHDTVLDLTFTRPGLDALCRVLEAWVRHFLDAEVSIQPVQKIDDEKWVWHVGLDAEASAFLNDLYNGAEVEDERHERLLSLFRLEFKDPALMDPEVRGRPVYMATCMTAGNRLRMKPQNLLVNLPLTLKQ